MRVIVDESLCEANGFCESLAPDYFEIGHADVVHVADGEVPEHLEIDVRAAQRPEEERASNYRAVSVIGISS